MRIKDGVIMNGLKIEMRKVLVSANEVWTSHGQTLWVTAALDGEHSAGSLHYYGYAVDLRSRYFDAAEKLSVVRDLKFKLGADYDVISHSSHIHVEYDPK